MKAFIITQADIDRLLTLIDRDPKHGRNGGSSDSSVRDSINDQAYDRAHGFYNYQVRKWIDEIQK